MTAILPSRRDADAPALTARHRAALWRYLRVLGATPADADDLAQEAFLVALRRPDFDGTSPAGVFGFLRTTARHLWLRSRKRTMPARQIAEADAIWEERCGDGPGDRYVEALRCCLAALPERSQELLRATYAEEMGRAATASRFGLGANGVKSALRRLRARLHDCITTRLAEDR